MPAVENVLCGGTGFVIGVPLFFLTWFVAFLVYGFLTHWEPSQLGHNVVRSLFWGLGVGGGVALLVWLLCRTGLASSEHRNLQKQQERNEVYQKYYPQ